MSVTIKTKEADGIAIMELSGRLTLGEATGTVREAVRKLIAKGHQKVIVNLKEVSYIDSAGLGEIVGAYTSVKSHRGDMKLVGASGRALDLLQVTRLLTLFEVFDDEAAALRSFQ